MRQVVSQTVSVATSSTTSQCASGPAVSSRRLPRRIAAVDLFCGVGGMTHGLIRSGIAVVAGIDIDRTCEYAYTKNNGAKFLCKSIADVTGDDDKSLFPKGRVKMLVGCAPCQPFSKHTQKSSYDRTDERWMLLREFSRLVREVLPEIVSMENVPLLAKHSVFSDFTSGLVALGYTVAWRSVFCPRYGIPQSRARLVLLASRLGEIGLLPETHSPPEYPTVMDYIGSLEHITAGGVSAADPLHRSRGLSSINMRRMRQSKPGGTWADWKPELRAKCHRKKSGRTYSAVYSRMAWNRPGPTITTQFFTFGTGRFGHPVQDRALSLREGALLQTFPVAYDFVNPSVRLSTERIGMQIGNAVPVRLGEIVGLSVQRHVEATSGR